MKKKFLIYWVLVVITGVIVIHVSDADKWVWERLTRPGLHADCQSWSLKDKRDKGYATYTLIEIQNKGLLSRSAKKIHIKVKTVSPIEKLCLEPGSHYQIVAGGEGEKVVEMKITGKITRGKSYLLGIWNKTNSEYSFGKVAAAHVPVLTLLDEENQK